VKNQNIVTSYTESRSYLHAAVRVLGCSLVVFLGTAHTAGWTADPVSESYVSKRKKLHQKMAIPDTSNSQATKVLSLVGKRIVNAPIEVQGETTTIVRRVEVINNEPISDGEVASPIVIKCPENGVRVVVSGVTVKNFRSGRLRAWASHGNSIAAPMVVQCDGWRPVHIEMDGVRVVSRAAIESGR